MVMVMMMVMKEVDDDQMSMGFAGGAPLPNAALSHPWRVFVECGGEDSGSED